MPNKNKTALQMLKEKLEIQKEFYGTRFSQFLVWIDELMEYEKELIEDAFVAGYDRYTIETPLNSEQYYYKTFKNA